MKGRVVAAIAIAGAAAYFVVAFAFLPQIFLPAVAPPRPAPAVNFTVSDNSIALGESFMLQVSATNGGDHADRQMVSIAFPNATRAQDVVQVQEYGFRQSPRFIEVGQDIGYGYTGVPSVLAQYPTLEAHSAPWEAGESFSASLSITPAQEGRFVVFVKAVGLPHNGDQAHWPSSGPVDHQDEYVSVVEIDVTKA
jgi:hypothetical protein